MQKRGHISRLFGALRFRKGMIFCAFVGSAFAADHSLQFHHLWKGEPLMFDEWMERDGGEKVSISRLAYLVSMPSLEELDGRHIEQKNWFGFINAQEALNRVALSGLPDWKFAALGFSVGLDEVTNKSDPNKYPPTHPLNPVRNNLHWSWQSSYIFFAIEGRWRSADGKESGFSYHLGNAGMLMSVKIPSEFDVAKAGTIAVDFHLERVIGDSTAVPIDEQTSSHGRDGDDLAVVLKRKIEKAFTLREIAAQAALETVKKADAPSLVGTPYRFTMPAHFPMPNLPLDFPLTNERVELGRRLFNEKMLSQNGTINCASCHSDAAFSDARKFSIGLEGKATPRHGMPLVNLAWKSKFFWDGRASSLREQALVPIQDAVEMHETLPNVTIKLEASKEYPALFGAAYGDSKITPERIGVAIEQFIISLTSFDSKFDRAHKGEGALSAQEKRGFELFFTEYEPRLEQFGADCFHCHGGAFFTDHGFHNNGLAFRSEDLGLGKITGRAPDNGKFSTPSLRNIAATAPYMHDGRFATLEEVVEHYTSGIHPSPTLNPNLAKHSGRGIPLTAEDKAALVAFLKTLTDSRFEK